MGKIKTKEYIIDNPKILIKEIPNASVLMSNLMHPFTQGRYHEFRRIYKMSPGKSVDWYSSKIGVSVTMIREYALKLDVDIVSPIKEKYDYIKKMIQQKYITYKDSGNGISISLLARRFDVSWRFAKSSIEEINDELAYEDFDLSKLEEMNEFI